MCRVLNSKPYQYFWFNYLQPNQDWWQGYLSAGRNHDTPPSFRLPCLNILKSPSQASKSSTIFTSLFQAQDGGWSRSRLPLAPHSFPGVRRLTAQRPTMPMCTIQVGLHPKYLHRILQQKIFTPYFATNHSFFFNFKLLTAPWPTMPMCMFSWHGKYLHHNLQYVTKLKFSNFKLLYHLLHNTAKCPKTCSKNSVDPT